MRYKIYKPNSFLYNINDKVYMVDYNDTYIILGYILYNPKTKEIKTYGDIYYANDKVFSHTYKGVVNYRKYNDIAIICKISPDTFKPLREIEFEYRNTLEDFKVYKKFT